MNGGRGLDVRGNNHSMLPQVELEGVSCPPPLGLHHIEGNSPEKILEGGPNPDAMPLQWFEARGTCSLLDSLQEFRLGERAACVFGDVCE
jgi:hypothetical protein